LAPIVGQSIIGAPLSVCVYFAAKSWQRIGNAKQHRYNKSFGLWYLPRFAVWQSWCYCRSAIISFYANRSGEKML